MHILIVNLDEVPLDKALFVFPAVDSSDYLIETPRNDASEVVDILFVLFVWALSVHAIELDIVGLFLHVLLPAHDGVSLAASRLSIGKNGAIVSIKDILDNGESGVLIDILLCGIW